VAAVLVFCSAGASAAAPGITSLSPSSRAVGTLVTGTSFGAPQGTSTIKFNGTAATLPKHPDAHLFDLCRIADPHPKTSPDQ